MSRIPTCDLCGKRFRIDNIDYERIKERLDGQFFCKKCESAVNDAEKQKLFSEVEWAVKLHEVDPDLLEFYENELQELIENRIGHAPKVHLRSVTKKGVGKDEANHEG